MNQNYQWKENAYEPGLFTFYLQSVTRQQLTHKINPEQRSERVKVESNDKYNFKIKQGTQRYTTTYEHWNISNQIKNRRNASQNQLSKYILRKKEITQVQIDKTQQKVSVSEIRVSSDKRNGRRQIKSQIQLKKKNVNDCFRFDINKTKSRMFIFRGQPVRLVRNTHEVSKQIQKVTKNDPMNKQVTKSLMTLNKKQRISETKLKNSNVNIRYNFLQFLMERKKKQNVEKVKQRFINRNDLTLNKLLNLKAQNLIIGTRVNTER